MTFNIKPWFVVISIHTRVKVNVLIYLSILLILRHFASCKLLKRDGGDYWHFASCKLLKRDGGWLLIFLHLLFFNVAFYKCGRHSSGRPSNRPTFQRIRWFSVRYTFFNYESYRIVPLQHFFGRMPWLFRSDSVGRLKGRSEECRSVALPPFL